MQKPIITEEARLKQYLAENGINTTTAVLRRLAIETVEDFIHDKAVRDLYALKMNIWGEVPDFEMFRRNRIEDLHREIEDLTKRLTSVAA